MYSLLELISVVVATNVVCGVLSFFGGMFLHHKKLGRHVMRRLQEEIDKKDLQGSIRDPLWGMEQSLRGILLHTADRPEMTVGVPRHMPDAQLREMLLFLIRERSVIRKTNTLCGIAHSSGVEMCGVDAAIQKRSERDAVNFVLADSEIYETFETD